MDRKYRSNSSVECTIKQDASQWRQTEVWVSIPSDILFAMSFDRCLDQLKKIKETKNNEKVESQNQAKFGMLRHNVHFFSVPRCLVTSPAGEPLPQQQHINGFLTQVHSINVHLLHLNTFIQLSSDSRFVCSVNTCTLYHFSYVVAHILFSILLIKENCGIAQSVQRLPGLTL